MSNPNPDRDERVREVPERIWIDARMITTPSMRVLHGEPPPDGVASVEYVRANLPDAVGAGPQWSREAPTVDGVYWWRADERDSDPDIHEVQGEFFYQVGFGSSEVVANFGGEWFGPITPTSADIAATRMRDRCVVHLQSTADALDVRQETECPSGTAFNSEAALRRRIATELQSLTLEGEQKQ